MAKKYTRYSIETINLIEKLYKEDVRIETIARTVGRSPASVKKKLEILGIKRKNKIFPNSMSPDEKKHLTILWVGGKTIKEIAKIMNRSSDSISYWRKISLPKKRAI